MRYLLLSLLLIFLPSLQPKNLWNLRMGRWLMEDLNQNFQTFLSEIETLKATVAALEARIETLEPAEGVKYDGWLIGDAVVSSDGLTVSADFYRAERYGIRSSAYPVQVNTIGKLRLSGPDQLGSRLGIVGGNYEDLPNYREEDAATNWYGIVTDGARKIKNGSPVAFSDGRLATYAGDVFRVAVDLDLNHIYFGKNEIWLGNANPESGVNPAYEIEATTYFAQFEAGAEQCVPHVMTTNFGASVLLIQSPAGISKAIARLMTAK